MLLKCISLLYTVKYFIAIIFMLFAISSFAQNEQWDTYMAKFGDKPGSVLVDLNLYNTAPDKKYPNLVITGPRAHKCNAKGLPETSEIDALEDILTSTDNFLTGVTAKVLCGTFTYKCERLNYYYVKDTVGIRNALARMYGRSYKDYDYAVNIKSDPDWVTYRTFLYPDEATQNWMENDKIVTKLLQTGDSLTMKRDVIFSFYFRTDTDRVAFANYAAGRGYKTQQPESPKGESKSYPLLVSTYAYVKMDAICALSTDLKKEARLHHGIYNYWTAPFKK